jgi:hypothetical protein
MLGKKEGGKRDWLRDRRRRTYVATEVRGAVRAVADNPKDCRGAWLFTLELAAFLSWP